MKIVSIIGLFALILLSSLLTSLSTPIEEEFLSYTVNPKIQQLEFFWKDDKGKIINNFANLKLHLELSNKKLLFAMNGGIYEKEYSPKGLYIENGRTEIQLDTGSGFGNFYLKPNGVFFLTYDLKAEICNTIDFHKKRNVKFATQSGPLLVINGAVNPIFDQMSKSLNIRNGVGILPEGKVLFAMSKKELNLYEFASYFRRNGCTQALYLDGYISKTYLPEKNWIHQDGEFAIIIAEIE
jgi:uncharacterized protein YigE (DUF2233 family)